MRTSFPRSRTARERNDAGDATNSIAASWHRPCSSRRDDSSTLAPDARVTPPFPTDPVQAAEVDGRLPGLRRHVHRSGRSLRPDGGDLPGTPEHLSGRRSLGRRRDAVRLADRRARRSASTAGARCLPTRAPVQERLVELAAPWVLRARCGRGRAPLWRPSRPVGWSLIPGATTAESIVCEMGVEVARHRIVINADRHRDRAREPGRVVGRVSSCSATPSSGRCRWRCPRPS